MFLKKIKERFAPKAIRRQVVSDVFSRTDFIKAASNPSIDATIFITYKENAALSEYLSTLTAQDLNKLCPVFGEVSIGKNSTDAIVLDDKKFLPPILQEEILMLAKLYQQAVEAEDIRFTLSSIRSGHEGEAYHQHYQTFMTYPFINLGTEWPEGAAPSKKPFLFKPMFNHRSPFVPEDEPRMVCTFFPKPAG